jgi:hypothetical protein
MECPDIRLAPPLESLPAPAPPAVRLPAGGMDAAAQEGPAPVPVDGARAHFIAAPAGRRGASSRTLSPRRLRWPAALPTLSLSLGIGLVLCLSGCDRSASGSKTSPAASAPTAPTALAAQRATRYRQGLCKSMQMSLGRLESRRGTAEADAKDLASIRFALDNLLGAFPPNSAAPDSRLRVQASDTATLLRLRFAAQQAVDRVAQAARPEQRAQALGALRQSCLDCHAALTTGVVLAASAK